MSRKSLVRFMVSLCSCNEVVVYFPCDRVRISGAGPLIGMVRPKVSQQNTHIVLR